MPPRTGPDSPGPSLVITPGEPAGIGPDITLARAMQAFDGALVAAADTGMMAARAALLGLEIELIPLQAGQAVPAHRPGVLPVWHTPLARDVIPGRIDPGNAAGVLAALDRAVAACRSGAAQAMVTGPVQKSVMNDAGIPFSGHTEYLAEITDTPQVVMMLAIPGLRVALATTHLPLAAVPAAITTEVLRDTLTILHRDLQRKFGLAQPRIAVLGLNPHAGEGGHLGREELDTIIPVLNALRQHGMDLQGPLPADTAFNRKVLDQADAVFAMYHDQGLPVLKHAGFGEAVNITLGLPLIRTSVDHGTALDLAGSGAADPTSLDCALRTAAEMAAASGAGR